VLTILAKADQQFDYYILQLKQEAIQQQQQQQHFTGRIFKLSHCLIAKLTNCFIV